MTKSKAIKLKDIKELISGKEIADSDEIEKLTKLKEESSIDDIKLAILYVKCYNFIEINISQFKDDEKNYTKQVKKILEEFEIENIRCLVNEYNSGKDYGDYIFEERIKQAVKSNRKKYLRLIRIFFEIFSSED